MIGIIVNPHARGARDPDVAARLQAVLRAKGAEGLARIEVTWDLAALRAAVLRFCRDREPVVAVCGGDGTMMATLTELISAYGPADLPRLLLLRGGTVNTVARNLQISGRPEDLLAALLERAPGPADLSSLPLWGQDLIRVRSGGGEQEAAERYGCLFAAAMGARFLEAYYAGPRHGAFEAALLTARTVASTMMPGGGRLARRLFADTEATVWVDGAEVPERHFRLLLGATVPDVGLGMRVTWQAGRQPGRLHVVASRLPISTMARQLLRVRRGEALSGAPHLDRLARSLRVRFSSPQPYTLDGDLFRATEVELEIGPRLHIIGRLA